MRRSLLTCTILLLSSLLVFGCRSHSQTVLTDSTLVERQHSGSAANTSDQDELQIPSVPTITHKQDSALSAAHALPEADQMDVRSRVQVKALSTAETVARGVELFVTDVERDDSVTIVHTVLQNLWGRGTREHPDPISVKLSEDQVQHAKLLDDQTGKTHISERARAADDADALPSADWQLAPGETRKLDLVFSGLPRTSHSVTLIIPGFVTATGIDLGKLE